jgi:hypothetical protein
MRGERDRKHSRADEKVTIVAVNASEQTRRVQEAVARRAYEIFENRGSASWHELEDWRQAEAELVGPRCSGEMSLNGSLWLGTDGAIFKDGTIEIWVAPRKITICGEANMDKVHDRPKHIEPHQSRGMIFHPLDLPVEIDPSHVTAKFNGPFLELLLRKVQAKPRQEAHLAAA